MKLYLSSVGIPDKQAFRALLPADKTPQIGFIKNAWDVYPVEKSAPFTDGRLQDLASIGCTPKIIDLRDFKNRPDELRNALAKLDAVWLTGGNSFYLNWLLRESGFSPAIKPLLEAGLVYGGESAGAVITGTTLHGVELMDDQADAPEVIWDGLGWIDFGIVPHWGNPKYTAILEQCRSEMTKYVKTVKTLSDGEYLTRNEATKEGDK